MHFHSTKRNKLYQRNLYFIHTLSIILTVEEKCKSVKQAQFPCLQLFNPSNVPNEALYDPFNNSPIFRLCPHNTRSVRPFIIKNISNHYLLQFIVSFSVIFELVLSFLPQTEQLLIQMLQHTICFYSSCSNRCNVIQYVIFFMQRVRKQVFIARDMKWSNEILRTSLATYIIL